MALSKTQNRRLGALLSVMFAEELTEDDLEDVIKDGLVVNSEGLFKVTKKGLDEKNRLCTLAGLNIKYSSEKKGDQD
tara:strand:+ start:5245 stop:5475 length:231 start_codon:yes stop_codon:yes gene_type:complete